MIMIAHSLLQRREIMNRIRNPINQNLKNVIKAVNFDEEHLSIDFLIKHFKGWKITPVCRLFLLNDDESIRTDISRDVISYDLSVTYQSGQRRSLNISLVNINNKWKPKYNTGLVQIGSKFRFDIGFVINTTAYWKQMGIFLLKDPNMSRESSNQTISFSLCDKFGLFDGTLSGKTGLKDIVPVGVPMYQAFVTMVTADKGNGIPFDMKPILFNSKYKNQMTYYTIKQDAGNTLSKIFTDLADTISSDVYYNEYGNLCIESNVNEFINGNLPLVWHFTEDGRDRLSFSTSETSSNIVNSVLVKGNIVNGYQFSASAKNTNPLSPTCIQYRGELFDVISDQALYSDELCRDRAQYELLSHTRGTSTVSISCPFLPIFDVNQSVLLDFPSDDIENTLCSIDTISFSSGGNMSLTLSNINEVIF